MALALVTGLQNWTTPGGRERGRGRKCVFNGPVRRMFHTSKIIKILK